ncbi:MAG: MBL fold metallo-hydrolase [Syntrophales bacterium]|nr:MBL fold metallo-hydrolase [Syntrophales bacterium]
MKHIERIGPLWFIRGQNRGRYPYCHSIFLPEAGILIDPASDRETLTQMRDEGLVKAIWLSHWHEDHFKDLDLFDDLPFFIARKDAPPLSSLEEFLAGYDSEEDFAYWQQVLLTEFHFRPRYPAGYLIPGTTVVLPGTRVDVIAAPGHTPGHVALFFQEGEILFLADYDLTPFGPWYGDHNSSIEDTLASLRYLRNIPARVWLTSHETGIFTSSPGELWDKYEGVVYEREKRLLQALEKPKTMEEIVNLWIIYGRPREPRAFFAFGERAHMKKHLKSLIDRGLVTHKNGLFSRAD